MSVAAHLKLKINKTGRIISRSPDAEDQNEDHGCYVTYPSEPERLRFDDTGNGDALSFTEISRCQNEDRKAHQPEVFLIKSAFVNASVK